MARLWEEFPIAPSSPVAGMGEGGRGQLLHLLPVHLKDEGISFEGNDCPVFIPAFLGFLVLI